MNVENVTSRFFCHCFFTLLLTSSYTVSSFKTEPVLFCSFIVNLQFPVLCFYCLFNKFENYNNNEIKENEKEKEKEKPRIHRSIGLTWLCAMLYTLRSYTYVRFVTFSSSEFNRTEWLKMNYNFIYIFFCVILLFITNESMYQRAEFSFLFPL